MIKNFTPHLINILLTDEKGDRVVTIEPEELVIRLTSETKSVGFTDSGIPLTNTIFGKPEGLPEQKVGTLLIVSQLVKSALPTRKDLVVPAEVVRDGKGRIIGCRSLGI